MRGIASKAALALLAGIGLTGCSALPRALQPTLLAGSTLVAGGGADLYLLEPYDPARAPVVFVHGAGGSPQDWKAFVDGLDRKRFQAWLYGFPSGASPEALASLLYEKLSSLRAEYRFESVHFVAHSLGGLVVRSLLGRYSERFPYVCLFVSISTPWGGEALARFAPPDFPGWSAMNPRGPFLDSLFEAKLSPEVDFYLFFSYRGPRRFLRGTTDGAVSLSSELSPRAQAEARKVLGFDEDHTSILSSATVVEAFNSVLASYSPAGFPSSSRFGEASASPGSAQASKSSNSPFVAPLWNALLRWRR